MKIILNKNVPGLGALGAIKQVSAGYARNFLLPKNLARLATDQTLEQIKKETGEREAKRKKQQDKAVQLKNELEGKTFSLQALANKETLFAAVSPQQIVEAVKQKIGAEIQAEQLHIPSPIKHTGPTEVDLKLTPDVRLKLKINVEAQHA
ncbi:MAG: 50S ribosomal protein L9 [Candidatus Doudnabacteria bacterium]|nr:50S ribosomal protein L9 [Candidatus Doudnabacteria bacterium]